VRLNSWAFLVVLIVASTFQSAARADFAASNVWFTSLDSQTRLVLQADLVLVGSYDGLIDGSFGTGTFAAVTEYQGQKSAPTDGVLSRQQMDGLRVEAQAIYGRLGIVLVTDTEAGVSVYQATKLLVSRVPVPGIGNIYSSDDGLIALRTQRISHAAQPFQSVFGAKAILGGARQISYTNWGSTSFTVTGTDGDRFFYDRFYDDGANTVGFELTWTKRYQKVGTMLSVFMASFSYPTGKSESAAPDQRPPQANSPGSEQQLFSGSGFFFNGEGMIATNYHVAGECRTITVPGYGAAKLLKGDPALDLAVIQLTTQDYASVEPAVIRTQPPALAESVLLLGYPLADILNSSLNVSIGIVSAESGMTGQPNWFTTNAGIEPGNSGGPLLDLHGNVIGVAVAKIDDVKLLAQAGTSAPNVGFAIKNTVLLDFLESLSHASVYGDDAAPGSTAQQISALGKGFTVQIICESSAAATVAPAAAASLQTPRSGPRLAIYGGLDFYGNDIANGRTADAVECATDCRGDQQCRAFTFNANPTIHSGPNCFLKGDVGRIEAYSTAISGEFLSSQQTARQYDFDAIDPTRDLSPDHDLSGNDLFSYPDDAARTLDKCRMTCIDNQSCRAFSFVAASRQCWLKGSVGQEQFALGITSGQKRRMSIAPSDVVNVGL
jgi:serine protease Do